MPASFLNKPDDMAWLRDVHWKTLPPEYKSAFITGNEDAPEAIAAYLNKDPSIRDTPLMWTPPDAPVKLNFVGHAHALWYSWAKAYQFPPAPKATTMEEGV